MKTIVTETALKTKFWSAAIRTVAYFLGNGFTVPQPRRYNYIPRRKSGIYWIQVRRAVAAAVEISLWTR